MILKLISNKKNKTIVFNLSLVLLLVEIDSIIKKCSCKEHIFIAYSIDHIEMIFALLIEVIAFYMQAFIIQVQITSL